jgi:hypothetical protein
VSSVSGPGIVVGIVEGLERHFEEELVAGGARRTGGAIEGAAVRREGESHVLRQAVDGVERSLLVEAEPGDDDRDGNPARRGIGRGGLAVNAERRPAVGSDARDRPVLAVLGELGDDARAVEQHDRIGGDQLVGDGGDRRSIGARCGLDRLRIGGDRHILRGCFIDHRRGQRIAVAGRCDRHLGFGTPAVGVVHQHHAQPDRTDDDEDGEKAQPRDGELPTGALGGALPGLSA